MNYRKKNQVRPDPKHACIHYQVSFQIKLAAQLRRGLLTKVEGHFLL